MRKTGGTHARCVREQGTLYTNHCHTDCTTCNTWGGGHTQQPVIVLQELVAYRLRENRRYLVGLKQVSPVDTEQGEQGIEPG